MYNGPNGEKQNIIENLKWTALAIPWVFNIASIRVFVSNVSAVPCDKQCISLSDYSKRSLYVAEFCRELPSNKLKNQDKTQSSSDWSSDTHGSYNVWTFLSCSLSKI